VYLQGMAVTYIAISRKVIWVKIKKQQKKYAD
jgi:hypothetical protein